MTNIIKIFPARTIACALALFSVFFMARAQEQAKTPGQQEQEVYDMIGKEVEKYSRTLSLDPAQEFYMDSILTHNIFAMREEMTDKSKAKVANADIYQAIQDKWQEKTYVAFRAILDEDQWAKYLKGGAAKEKKARDKRMAKRSEKN